MVIDSIQTNIPALDIIQQIRGTNRDISTGLERLSTGLRINSAADNPGGFTVSNRLQTQFRSVDRAAENAQEGINFTSVALDAIDSIIDLLQNIRTDALAASNTGALDLNDRIAFQQSIEERISDINRIANTTRFGSTILLNGDFDSRTEFRNGTRSFGGQVAFGPNASTLLNGSSFLNLSRIQEGSERIRSGGDGTINTGISQSTDLAVSIGQFVDNGGASAVSGTTLFNSTFDTVSLATGGSITFQGVLANGTTEFSGTFSISGTSTLSGFISTIQARIDASEDSIGINSVGGTNTLETNVQLNTTSGRLEFFSGTTGSLSEFDVSLTFRNAADAIQTQQGITRSDTIANSQLAQNATGSQIGNDFTAITGSTFDSGTFDIEISNVQAAQQQILTAESGFFTDVSLTTAATGATFLRDAFLGSIDIDNGDVLVFEGANADGSTFSTSITVVNPADGVAGNGEARSIDDLLDELNFRDQTGTSFGFTGSTATLSGGAIQIIDNIAQDSQTDFFFTINDTSAPGTSVTVDNTVTQEGRAASATLQVANGTSQTVSAGQIVTVTGGDTAASGQSAAQATFRLGPTLTAGNDTLRITAETFQGSLNNGPAVTFFSGQSNVTFFGGSESSSAFQTFQTLSIDFDSILDVTSSSEDGGETFQLTSTSDNLQFRVGTNQDEDTRFFLADLRSSNLGTSSSETLDNIDVTTLNGANTALTIIDNALEQVNAVNSRLGAFSARLEDSVDQLNTNSIGLETAFNQIVSADIVEETNDLALNSVLLEAQTAVLAQANVSADQVFRILYGLDS